MCESKAFLVTSEGKELLLEDVTSIRPEGNGYRLVNLFGEQRHVPGRLADIDLLNHRVVFEPVPSNTPTP